MQQPQTTASYADHPLSSALGWLALGSVAFAVCFGPYTNLYIAPGMVWLVATGGTAAILVGLIQLWINLLPRKLAPTNPTRRLSKLAALLVLVAPLVFYTLVTPKAFGADTVRSGSTISMIGAGAVEATPGSSVKQFSLEGAPTVTPVPLLGGYNDEGVWSPDLVQLSEALNSRSGSMLGKPLRTLGFLYREADTPQGTFILSRFVTIHCSAEARPLGILVKSEAANRITEGTWVWVEGTTELTKVAGTNQPQIVASSVEPTYEPASPYILLSTWIPKRYMPPSTSK